MYDFNITVKATHLYEVIGTKVITEYDQRDIGGYKSTVEVKGRCTDWNEVIAYIRSNPEVTIKQVVELKDVTEVAKNHARDTGGYKD